jgi:SOS-response transcriptional repressor LexA
MATATLTEVQPLTPRQREIYEWIFEFTKDHGYQPTFRQVMSEFGIRSPNGILSFLKVMAKKGWVDRSRDPGDTNHSIRFLVTPRGRSFQGFVER